MKTALQIRKQIGSIGFDYWVRCWRDGSTWVGPVDGSQRRCDILIGRLQNLGFSPVMKGKAGTSGEWIIDI